MEETTLTQLQKRHVQLSTELKQIQAMVPTYQGALGECQRMIDALTEQETAPVEEKKPKAKKAKAA